MSLSIDVVEQGSRALALGTQGPEGYSSSFSSLTSFLEGQKKASEEDLWAAGIWGALPGVGVIGRGATVARTRFVWNCPACKESKQTSLKPRPQFLISSPVPCWASCLNSFLCSIP